MDADHQGIAQAKRGKQPFAIALHKQKHPGGSEGGNHELRSQLGNKETASVLARTPAEGKRRTDSAKSRGGTTRVMAGGGAGKFVHGRSGRPQHGPTHQPGAGRQKEKVEGHGQELAVTWDR